MNRWVRHYGMAEGREGDETLEELAI